MSPEWHLCETSRYLFELPTCFNYVTRVSGIILIFMLTSRNFYVNYLRFQLNLFPLVDPDYVREQMQHYEVNEVEFMVNHLLENDKYPRKEVVKVRLGIDNSPNYGPIDRMGKKQPKKLEYLMSQGRVAKFKRTCVLSDQKISEDNQELRPGCPPDY